MHRLAIESSCLRAEVVPELGAGLAGLWARAAEGWTPLLRPTPQAARWFNSLSSYLLAPWPNRIAGASFTWQGRHIALRPDWPDGTAIHGLVKEMAWKVISHDQARVGLAVAVPAGDSPWAFECSARYELDGSTFRNTLTVRNTSAAGAMPCGLGFHPFFARPGSAPTLVRAPVRGHYPVRDVLPTGPATDDDLSRSLRHGLLLDRQALDEVFAGSLHGAEVTWPDRRLGVTIACSPNLGHTVLYSAGVDQSGRAPESFCLEPVSMLNNGLNLAAAGWEGTGVVGLDPGEAIEAWWSVRLGPD